MRHKGVGRAERANRALGTTQILARARSHHYPETEETRGGGSDSGGQEPGLPGRNWDHGWTEKAETTARAATMP